MIAQSNIIAERGMFLRDIVFYPEQFFDRIRNGRSLTESVGFFVGAEFITFLKSFMLDRTYLNFFSEDWLNTVFAAASIPQVSWLISMLSDGEKGSGLAIQH